MALSRRSSRVWWAVPRGNFFWAASHLWMMDWTAVSASSSSSLVYPSILPQHPDLQLQLHAGLAQHLLPHLVRQLQDIGKALEEETGCTVTVHLSEGYPAVWNHEELYAHVAARLGADAPRLMEAPVLAAEDFSFYQQYTPGVFFLLGVGDTPQLHAPEFAFDDEAVLPKGVEFLKKLLMLA